MPKPIHITYHVSTDPGALACAAAELFSSCAVSAVQAQGRARIAISGGKTPLAMFEVLADAKERYSALTPWAQVDLFWVDERCVGPEDAESNYGAARQRLLEKVPLAPENVHRIEGELEPEIAASRYEAAIRNAFKLEGAETPTFDLVLLGMGEDGHTASLFPHTDGLNEMARLAIANRVPQKDVWRVTLTWPVINQGREVAFLVEGETKAKVLHEVLFGAYDPETKPSQLIRPASGKLTLMLDTASASMLPPPVVFSANSDPTGTMEVGGAGRKEEALRPDPVLGPVEVAGQVAFEKVPGEKGR